MHSVVRQSAAPSSTTTSSPAIGGAWTELGPKPVANLDTFGNVSGRVTGLAVDPTNASIVYAATAGGGVWKTTNAGTNWSPLTDSQATLAIGAVAADPNNHLVVYAATGENDRCGDCELSQGVLKTTDGGASWTLYGQAVLGTGDTQASSIVVDKSNSNSVLLGTSTGLFHSADGGQTWAPNTNLNDFGPLNQPPPKSVDVILQDPTNPAIFWAAVGEHCQGNGFIAKSTDSGATWSDDFNMPAAVDRIGLAIGHDGTLYAAEASCPDANGGNFGVFTGLIKSTNDGASWSVIQTSASLSDYFSGGAGLPAQGFYDDLVAVDPTNSASLVIGGVTLLASTNGGTSFSDIAKPYSGGPLHPDFHAAAFTGANAFYVGNDGGIYKTTDLGGSGSASDWTGLNSTLEITQFYSGTALSPTNMIGGAQDQDTDGLVASGPTPPAWKPLLDGDGTWTAMDPTANSTTIYAENPFGFIFKGSSTATITNPNNPSSGWSPAGPCWFQGDLACTEPSGFVAPFLMDPSNPQHLWSGTNRVWETTQGGVRFGTTDGEWIAISPDLTTGTNLFTNGDWISSMSQDGGVLATASFGGAVWVDNGRLPAPNNWVNATGNLPVASQAAFGVDAWITDIAAGATSRSGVGNYTDLWVTLSGNGVGHVWHSTAGPSGQGPWVDMSGSGMTGVGNLVADSIAVTSSAVFIGTDAGALACFTCISGAGAPAWFPIGSGLPNAKVDALRVSGDGSTLVAWTHGRGVWSIPLQAQATISQPTLAFGNQTADETSSPLTETLTSAGLVDLSFSGAPSIQGTDASEFQLQPTSCTFGYPPLTYNQSCSLQVTFTPNASGPKSATLVIPDNVPGGQQTVALSGNGIVPVVSVNPSTLAFGDVAIEDPQQLSTTVTNSGDGNLDITSTSITGSTPGDFSASTNCQHIAKNGTCSVTVGFYATSTGAASATLNLVDNAADSPQQLSLTGNGVTPAVGLNPTSLSFGSQALDTSSAEQLIAITNQGPIGNLRVFAGTPGGADASSFVVSSNSCQALPIPPTTGSNTCTIGVEFHPLDVGDLTGTLFLADNGAGNPQLVPLSGTGLGPKLNPPASLNVGYAAVGARVTQDLVLKNIGNTDLPPLILTVGGQNSSDFGAIGCDTTVAAGASCTVTVSFTADGVGSRSGFLELSDSTAVAGLPAFLPLTAFGSRFRSVQPAVSASPLSSFRGRMPPPRGLQPAPPAPLQLSVQPLSSTVTGAPSTASGTQPSRAAAILALRQLMRRIAALLASA